jgi:hypothetical protein
VWIHIREQMKISIGHGRLNDLTWKKAEFTTTA